MLSQAAQSFQSMWKPEQEKTLQAISSSADRIPNTSEMAPVKSARVQQTQQPLFDCTQLPAVVCKTKQSPQMKQQLSEERQNTSYWENTSPPTCYESLYLCSAFNYFPKNPVLMTYLLFAEIFEEEHIYLMCGRLTPTRPSYTML